jgi:endo-1,3-1,4-beta-glycanase ExoK
MRKSSIFVALSLSVVAACDDAIDAGTGGTGSSPVAGDAPGSAGSPNPGGSSSGGAGASSAGAGSGGASEPFVLLFRDDFDSLDTSRWQLMTHSWAGNLAKFAAAPVSVNDGVLTSTLLDAPAGTVDGGETTLFLGAEVRSFATLTYGRVRARIRFARASAVVSSLVTIYTPWPADNWNELDVESLGAEPSRVQFNSMVYTGPLPAPTTPVSPTTIWASSSAAWAGPVSAATSMASASYDWIELYSYSAR